MILTCLVGWILVSCSHVIEESSDTFGPDERAHVAQGHRMTGGGL